MQYKILTKSLKTDTTLGTDGKIQQAVKQLETDIQTLINDGWQLAGGVALTATKLGFFTIAQSVKKGD